MNHFNDKGQTLSELIIVLAVIAVILASGIQFGSRIFTYNTDYAFDNECEKVLIRVLQMRNESMMRGDSDKVTTVTFGRNYVDFTMYDEDQNRYLTERMPLEHCTLAGTFYNQDLKFLEAGTVSKGGNIAFLKNGKAERYLVIQVGSGRIYLSDVKPR